MTLVQEYLRGTEYVVDTVSCDGVHKVVAVWEYDKRAVNNAPFVYYGVLLREASGERILAIIQYILQVRYIYIYTMSNITFEWYIFIYI